MAAPRGDRSSSAPAQHAADGGGDAPGRRTEPRPGLRNDVPGTARHRGDRVACTRADARDRAADRCGEFLTIVPTPAPVPETVPPTGPVTFLRTVPTAPRPPVPPPDVGGVGGFVGDGGLVVVRVGDVRVGGRVGPVVGAGWVGWVVGGPPMVKVSEPPPPAATPDGRRVFTTAPTGVRGADRTPAAREVPTSTARRRATGVSDRAGALSTICAGVPRPSAFGQPRKATTALASTKMRRRPRRSNRPCPVLPDMPGLHAPVALSARLDAPLSSVMMAKSSLPFKLR